MRKKTLTSGAVCPTLPDLLLGGFSRLNAFGRRAVMPPEYKIAASRTRSLKCSHGTKSSPGAGAGS